MMGLGILMMIIFIHNLTPMLISILPFIFLSIAFICEALMDSANFYKDSKLWKYFPIKELNTPGDGMFKFDVFHLSKYIYIPCLILAGYFLTEFNIYTISIAIALRIVFFDRLLYIVKKWK